VGGLAILIVLVGPSRIQQGHHWPTDVSASYLLGLAYVLALAVLYERGRASAVCDSWPGRSLRRWRS